jgi:hypothetical protein
MTDTLKEITFKAINNPDFFHFEEKDDKFIVTLRNQPMIANGHRDGEVFYNRLTKSIYPRDLMEILFFKDEGPISIQLPMNY